MRHPAHPASRRGRSRPIIPGYDKSHWRDTAALVTCASSGIGEASARGLAERGATVAVAARRKSRLRRRLTPPEGGHGPVYQLT
jgi:3-oxoacyl-ACP reductase-like protein